MTREDARWRDGLFCELGKIKRGLDDLNKTLNGNGQPGRCALEQIAREKLAADLRELQDARQRRAWEHTLWRITEAAASVIAAAILLGLLHHFLGWL